jgi:hypothetical protein
MVATSSSIHYEPRDTKCKLVLVVMMLVVQLTHLDVFSADAVPSAARAAAAVCTVPLLCVLSAASAGAVAQCVLCHNGSTTTAAAASVRWPPEHT